MITMQKTFSTLAVAAMLAACSSAPKVATPDGSSRVPVNNEAALAAYQVQRAREDSDAKRRGELEASVAALQKQVADLKTYIVLKATETDINTPKGAPAQAPSASARKAGAGGKGGLHMVEVRDNALLFTVTHATAQTAFRVPPAMKDALLEASRASERIEVRGRTDANTPNLVDRDIALHRAMRAYAFLVRNGVAPERIKVTFESAGHFAVDNSTAEGRARNRRVEVEVVGADAAILARGA
jgi:outer membrane protein OmpA-like peptidoglycan-associated protein